MSTTEYTFRKPLKIRAFRAITTLLRKWQCTRRLKNGGGFAVRIQLKLSIVFTVILIITILDKIESLHGKRTKTYGRSRHIHSKYYGSGSGCWDNPGTNDMIMHQRMNDEANRQFMQQMQEDSDTAMKMATGIEFGGYNCDPNLNPGMDYVNDMSFSNDPGAFGGMSF